MGRRRGIGPCSHTRRDWATPLSGLSPLGLPVRRARRWPSLSRRPASPSSGLCGWPASSELRFGGLGLRRCPVGWLRRNRAGFGLAFGRNERRLRLRRRASVLRALAWASRSAVTGSGLAVISALGSRLGRRPARVAAARSGRRCRRGSGRGRRRRRGALERASPGGSGVGVAGSAPARAALSARAAQARGVTTLTGCAYGRARAAQAPLTSASAVASRPRSGAGADGCG